MASLLGTNLFAFADGNAGHACALGSGPAAGQVDVLCVNSDTVVATPSGFTLATSNVNSQGSYVFYRIASGWEASSVTVSTSGDFNCQVSHSRWGGLLAVDVTAKASTVGNSGTASPAVSTGDLAGAGELVIAFAALHSIGGSADQSTPVWSTGFTAVSGPNSQGFGPSGVNAFVGYKDGAGVGPESPSVSWSGSGVFDRDILVVVFTPAAGGISQPAGIASETDAAQTLGRTKQRPLGIAACTEVALPLLRRKSRTLGIAAESESPQPLGRQKTRLLGRASETDAARGLAGASTTRSHVHSGTSIVTSRSTGVTSIGSTYGAEVTVQ